MAHSVEELQAIILVIQFSIQFDSANVFRNEDKTQ